MSGLCPAVPVVEAAAEATANASAGVPAETIIWTPFSPQNVIILNVLLLSLCRSGAVLGRELMANIMSNIMSGRNLNYFLVFRHMLGAAPSTKRERRLQARIKQLKQ